jgi:hypothetical protein
MRRRLLAVCFLIAVFVLFATGRAKADEIFTYQFESNTFTWQLPASPSVAPPNMFVTGSFFELEDVLFSENGGAKKHGTLDFYNQAPLMGGGFEL